MIMRRILHALAARLPAPRLIYDREGKSPYLSRYYLIGKRPSDDDLDEHGNLREDARERPRRHLIPRVFLHRFHRSDADGELHSHPWAWAVAIVLSGGYSEERRVPPMNMSDWGVERTVVRRTFGPGSVNVIRADDYHRVDLLEDESWSLFISGPKLADWFFWDRETGDTTPWREFLEMRQRDPGTYPGAFPWDQPINWASLLRRDLSPPPVARETPTFAEHDAGLRSLEDVAAKMWEGLSEKERQILDERFGGKPDMTAALERVRAKMVDRALLRATPAGSVLDTLLREREAHGGPMTFAANLPIDDLPLDVDFGFVVTLADGKRVTVGDYVHVPPEEFAQHVGLPHVLLEEPHVCHECGDNDDNGEEYDDR